MSEFNGEVTLGSHEAMMEQVGYLQRKLATQTYPGYPEFLDRLSTNISDLARSEDGRLVIPDGPWTVDTHSNSLDSQTLPSLSQQEGLATKGLELDSAGRPLHPWFDQMIQNPNIGVTTGKGAYRKWGPNYTVDPIVIFQDYILLVKRRDTETWALPGGFIDPGETAAVAGPREVEEETCIILPPSLDRKEVYKGPVADIRVTANSWAETTAILYELDVFTALNGYPIGGDDAKGAAWVPLRIALSDNYLFGSHRYLLERALEQL